MEQVPNVNRDNTNKQIRWITSMEPSRQSVAILLFGIVALAMVIIVLFYSGRGDSRSNRDAIVQCETEKRAMLIEFNNELNKVKEGFYQERIQIIEKYQNKMDSVIYIQRSIKEDLSKSR